LTSVGTGDGGPGTATAVALLVVTASPLDALTTEPESDVDADGSGAPGEAESGEALTTAPERIDGDVAADGAPADAVPADSVGVGVAFAIADPTTSVLADPLAEGVAQTVVLTGAFADEA
jgi:hypothetical protein